MNKGVIMSAQVEVSLEGVSAQEKKDIKEGQGELEAFLILSKYIKVFGLSGNDLKSWKINYFNNRSNIIYSSIVACAAIISMIVVFLFWGSLKSEMPIEEAVMVSFVIIVLPTILIAFLFGTIFKDNYFFLNKRGKQKAEDYGRKKFLNEFGVDLDAKFDNDAEREKVFFFLNWCASFSERFNLNTLDETKKSLEKFKYLDEDGANYKELVREILLNVVSGIKREIYNDLGSYNSCNSKFLPFWKNAKDLKQKEWIDRSQLELLDKIKTI